jgi:hypothetical protein
MMEPGETLQRLMSIRQSVDEQAAHRNSRVALMREYLQRSAWWAQALNATDEWPFFDVAARIDPAVRANYHLVVRLEEFIAAEHEDSPSVATTYLAALHWSALVTTPGTQVPRMPDPFEPLLLMYERGGTFSTEHGFIDVGFGSILRRAWRDHLTTGQTVPLSADALDRLDSAGGVGVQDVGDRGRHAGGLA